jgi:hypothetical protein
MCTVDINHLNRIHWDVTAISPLDVIIQIKLYIQITAVMPTNKFTFANVMQALVREFRCVTSKLLNDLVVLEIQCM